MLTDISFWFDHLRLTESVAIISLPEVTQVNQELLLTIQYNTYRKTKTYIKHILSTSTNISTQKNNMIIIIITFDNLRSSPSHYLK